MYIANVINKKGANFVLDRHRVDMRKKGFVWSVYLLALSAESRELYEHISINWNDLDVITGGEIGFIFANVEAATFLHRGNEMERSRYLPNKSRHSFDENNSVLVEKFIESGKIKLSQLPCLVFNNLISDANDSIIVPLSNDSDVVSIMKYISIRTDSCREKINFINECINVQYRRVEVYNDMKNRLIKVCHKNDAEEENRLMEAIIAYEDNNNSYTRQRLVDEWKIVCMNMTESVYGNSGNGLANKLCDVRDRINNFSQCNAEYIELVNNLDMYQKEMEEIIKGINTEKCKEDALSYAQAQINELEKSFFQYHIDEKISEEIINDFRKNTINGERKRYFTIHKQKEILEKIRNCETVRCIDDISRVMFILDIIFKTVVLF